MAPENVSPLEAILIRGLSYAFSLNDTDEQTKFIYCSAAIIVPVHHCTADRGRTIECNRGLFFFAGPEDIVLSKYIRPDESYSAETVNDRIFDVRFGKDSYRLCNFGGPGSRMVKMDFSSLNAKYFGYIEKINHEVTQWLKEVFKDGAK